eukprot:6177279-Pleurochrysis_carterae.AAC.2
MQQQMQHGQQQQQRQQQQHMQHLEPLSRGTWTAFLLVPLALSDLECLSLTHNLRIPSLSLSRAVSPSTLLALPP